MQPFLINKWYWIVGGDTTKVFSSAVRDYVPVADAAYKAWLADGNPPTIIDTEANLGAVFAPYLLRPIPQGVLDGYLDEQMKQIIIQPEFKLWIELYVTVMHPTPTEAQIRAHIRSIL